MVKIVETVQMHRLHRMATCSPMMTSQKGKLWYELEKKQKQVEDG